MIAIQLENSSLDIYTNTEIELSWEGFRFQSELKTGFTNDITIPKTKNNLSLLSAVGLLDSATQLFGDKITHATLYCNSNAIPVYLQVVAVRKDEIDICLYEDILPDEIKEKKLNECFSDGSNSIWRWNGYSASDYPTVFADYNYGMTYNVTYAQRHPSLGVSNLLYQIGQTEGITLPGIAQEYRLLATKKTVCPHNRVQVIEFNDTSMEGDYFNLHGGQHVTNNISMEEKTHLTYNRLTYTTFKFWIVWKKKGTTSQNKTIMMKINGNNYWWLTLPSGSTDTGCLQLEVSTYFSAGDTVSFEFSDSNKYQFVSGVCKMTHTTYYVYSDDFGSTELEYVARRPRMRITGTNDIVQYLEMDGDNHAVHHTDSSLTQFPTENLSFAYYGYFCNLPEVTLADLYYSLQWVLGKKLKYTDYGVTQFVDPDETSTLNGIITEIRPISSAVGQNNYISFDEQTASPVSTISNKWLEVEKDIHKSVFYYVTDDEDPTRKIRVLQYSNPETDEDTLETTCDFDEIDAPVLCYYNSSDNALYPVSLSTFGFEDMTQSMEADIETDTLFILDKDIVYLDGRKFFVISGTSNIKTGNSILTCLLVPTNINTTRSLEQQNNTSIQ